MVALRNKTTSEYARICADINGALDVPADTRDEFLRALDPNDYLKQQKTFELMDSKMKNTAKESSLEVATATEAPTTSYASITNPLLASKKKEEESDDHVL
jgi:hypothetical protein